MRVGPYIIARRYTQGSEYPAVVIPLSTHHYPMLTRKLLCTGLTRGKRLVVLVGQRRALAIAVRPEPGRAPALVQAAGLARRLGSTSPCLNRNTYPDRSQSCDGGL